MKTESSERYHDDKAKRASLAGGQSGFERKEMRMVPSFLVFNEEHFFGLREEYQILFTSPKIRMLFFC